MIARANGSRINPAGPNRLMPPKMAKNVGTVCSRRRFPTRYGYADGLARFLRLNRSGKGNYTLDRMQGQKDLGVADIVASLDRLGSH